MYRTPKEASQYLKDKFNVSITPGTLAVYRCHGRGPKYVKLNNKIYYQDPHLDQYIESTSMIHETTDSISA